MTVNRATTAPPHIVWLNRLGPYALKFILILAIFVFVALGSFWGHKRLFESFTAYRSPLAGVTQTTEPNLPQQVPQVILVILGGLSSTEQEALDLPTFEELRDSGANATVVSQTPAYALSTWMTLISGANPWLNDAMLVDNATLEVRPALINTLFHNAHQQGLQTAIVGHIRWQKLIAADLLSQAAFVEATDVFGDQQILAYLNDFLTPVDETDRIETQFVVVQFNQFHQAVLNQDQTSDSDAYTLAAQRLDAYLNDLVKLLDFSRTVLIVTADHGHIARGGYGGNDISVTNLPFIMLGKDIIPGTYSPIQQIDIAPTIATLLGLSLPAANQGRPLLEMLDLSSRERSQTLIALARQRIYLSQAYLSVVGAPLPDVSDFNLIRRFLGHGNHEGAAQLAQILIDEMDLAIQQNQPTNQGLFSWLRFVFGLGLSYGIIRFAWWQHSDLWGEAFVSAGIMVAAYHILYRVEGLPYSLSALNSVDNLWFDTARRILLALLAGGGTFLFLLLLGQVTNPALVTQGAYEYIYFALVGMMTPALYGFWQHGSLVGQILPDMALFFYHLMALMHSFWVVMGGVYFPPILVILNIGLQRGFILYQKQIGLG